MSVPEEALGIRRSRATAVVLVTLATFTDIVAYSICVPVLPDFARRLGASPTMIGVLFASFGLTLLAVSVPMGAVSDRVGRKVPLVAGMLVLAGASALFAVARTLPMMFVARMLQGAADGVTWGVGFALVADLYPTEDRGRVMGYVVSGTSVAILIGPTIGGWLYEAGGVSLPFFFVSALALVWAAGFLWIRPVRLVAPGPRPSIWSVVRVPAVAACAGLIVVVGATMAMLEPVLPLFFDRRLGLSPARIGLLFGGAAVASTLLPFVFGPMADRFGGRRVTMTGLAATAIWMPMLATAVGFRSALVLMLVQWTAIALVMTPSLAYMADVTAFAGGDAYGVGYGIFNTAWGMGVLVGPALGGLLFERLGFARTALGWSAGVLLVTLLLSRVKLRVPPVDVEAV